MSTMARRERPPYRSDRHLALDVEYPRDTSPWIKPSVRPVVYQEPYPEKARTKSSTAEAFRELSYTCPIERQKRRSVVFDLLCWALAIVLLVGAFMLPRWWK